MDAEDSRSRCSLVERSVVSLTGAGARPGTCTGVRCHGEEEGPPGDSSSLSEAPPASSAPRAVASRMSGQELRKEARAESALAEPVGARARHLMAGLKRRYPVELRAGWHLEVERTAFHVEQVFSPGAAIADLGGGIGLFAPTCAALGMRSFLIDDFRDPVNLEHPLQELEVHRGCGVEVIATEVRHWGEHFEDESLDVVTSFDSIEHWHHSPRRVFSEAFRVLRTGGVLFIGAPNAVNLQSSPLASLIVTPVFALVKTRKFQASLK